ncbi:hypothetical protein, partial [Ectothiorhodospira mobilis]|uniref:hypothetical protein n=1 Tax=Ectothiorhodospira mobilis TaxID=195064 RepID=UPI001EE94D04
IQVKASSSAWRAYKRKDNQRKNHWEWDVGVKGRKLCGSSIFYAFVNMRGKKGIDGLVVPEVFVVPSEIVADYLDRKMSRYIFWPRGSQREQYYEAWHLIADRLA